MKREFLDLGKQPIANAFLNEEEFESEYFFNLKVAFDEDTYLVSLVDFVDPPLMFNDSYVYYSSNSETMRRHFETSSNAVKMFKHERVLEIGSNDGVFLKHFDEDSAVAVEPCGNFADLTNDLGYKTYDKFWDLKLSKQILEKHGKQDVVFSANCMCHIQDLESAFKSVKNILSDDGIFVFEDPSLLKTIQRGSYDQFYDEHAHMFSVIALQNLFEQIDMEVFKVDSLDVHGGSNRVYVKNKSNKKIQICASAEKAKQEEIVNGLDKLSTYLEFSDRVKRSKKDLVSLLKGLKEKGEKIVSYGATSKSTTVFNYCGITTELIDHIVDTTPSKHYKHSPGTHIPVIPYSQDFKESTNYAFLGAWNYLEEITKKEGKYLLEGGKFIVHVPTVKSIGNEDE